MSLVDAPITERRRWVAKVATGLYNLQKARFGYISNGQSRERKLAWELVKKEKGPEYLRLISQRLASFATSSIANINKYWGLLLNAKEDQDFARLLTPNSYPPNSMPSEILISSTNYLPDIVIDVDEGLVDDIITSYTGAVEQGKVKSPEHFLHEVKRYAVGFGSFAFFNELKEVGFQSLDNKLINSLTVPCVISGIPLRHVREIEVARSGKILKFRATGSVFLANQEGGEDAIRIEGLFARNEIIFLMFLWMVFYYGQGRAEEATFDPTQTISQLAIRAKNFDATTWNKEAEKPSYTHHNTIPFVSRHIIIPNCYIETLSFEEKLEFGKDIIGYSILLRTYRAPKGFEVFDSESLGLNYIAPKGNKFLSMYKIIEFFANMAWRIIIARGYWIDEREWKTSGDPAGSDDVYYNMEGQSLISATILGVFGFII